MKIFLAILVTILVVAIVLTVICVETGLRELKKESEALRAFDEEGAMVERTDYDER